MLKPYYETDLGVLYHGDCLEIMPHLEPVDLVLTDPPYIGLGGGVNMNVLGEVARKRGSSLTMGDKWAASLKWLLPAWDLALGGLISFCSFHFVSELGISLPDNRTALLVWYQRNAAPSVNNAPHFKTEYIWAFKKAPMLKWRNLATMYDFAKLTAGCVSTGERLMDDNKKALHPTQKPKLLLIELLSIAPRSVLDPFSGTGTTAAACEDLGTKWIGIEIEEKYCEIAAKRIENERKQLKLF